MCDQTGCDPASIEAFKAQGVLAVLDAPRYTVIVAPASETSVTEATSTLRWRTIIRRACEHLPVAIVGGAILQLPDASLPMHLSQNK